MIDQKQLENVEYFNHLGRLIINDARWTREIKSRSTTSKIACSKDKNFFTNKLDLNLRKKSAMRCLCNIPLYGAETWIVRKVDQKYLGNCEMWYCRRTEISRTYCFKNEEVVHRVKEERNVLHSIKRRKANWISHLLRRNCLLKQITEGKMGGTGKRGRRRKELRKRDDTGNWKEEAPDSTLWWTHFRKGYGPVTIHTSWQWYPWQLCQSLL